MALATRVSAETLLCGYLEVIDSVRWIKKSGLFGRYPVVLNKKALPPSLEVIVYQYAGLSSWKTWRTESFQAGHLHGSKNGDGTCAFKDLVLATMYWGDRQVDRFRFGYAGGKFAYPGDEKDLPVLDWYCDPQIPTSYAAWHTSRYEHRIPWPERLKTCQACKPYRAAFTGHFKAAMRQATKYETLPSHPYLLAPYVKEVGEFWGLLDYNSDTGLAEPTGAGRTWATADARLDKIELFAGLLPPSNDPRVINMGPYSTLVIDSEIRADGSIIIGGSHNSISSLPSAALVPPPSSGPPSFGPPSFGPPSLGPRPSPPPPGFITREQRRLMQIGSEEDRPS